MTDEPRTAYYQTGAVRRLLATHKQPAQAAVLTNATRVLTAHDTRISALVPLHRLKISRQQVALLASVLALFVVAFVAGRKTAQPLIASNRIDTALESRAPARSTPAQSPGAIDATQGASRSNTRSTQAEPIDDGTLVEAVDALAVGDYSAALVHYRALAAARPHDEVLETIADILARKLQERCATRSSQGDPSCVDL